MAADGRSPVDDLLHPNTEATASKTTAPSDSLVDPSTILVYLYRCVIIRCTVSTHLFWQDALQGALGAADKPLPW